MKKVILIILFLALNILAEVNIRVDYPQFIKKGEKFSLSFISNFTEFDFDTLGVNLEFSTQLKIDSAKIQDFYASFPVINNNSKSTSYSFNFTRDKFNKDFLNQIIFYFEGCNREFVEINADFYFRKNGSEKYFISTDRFSQADKVIDINPVFFYEVQSSASNAAELKKSELVVELPEMENPLVEFWMKSYDGSGFEFISGQNEILSFVINRMGFADFDNHGKINFIDDFFLGCNWNHFTLHKDDEKTELLINGKKFAEIENYDFDVSQLAFSYKNILIDNLRIWDFNDKVELIERYIHHNYASLPDSKLKAFYQFDKEIIPNDFVHARNQKLVRSTAPIFTTRPELDIKVYEGYYLLSWKVYESEEIKYFEVERRTDKGNFETIAKLEPNGNKDYSFVDNKLPESDLVYYRVKQILKDGIINYSNEIKIGQNQKSLFILEQNYPNPFNPVTKFQVEMLKGANVTITVFNVVGNKITTVYRGFLTEGIHRFEFDGSELPSGIYFYEIKSNDFVEVKKMILTK